MELFIDTPRDSSVLLIHEPKNPNGLGQKANMQTQGWITQDVYMYDLSHSEWVGFNVPPDTV